MGRCLSACVEVVIIHSSRLPCLLSRATMVFQSKFRFSEEVTKFEKNSHLFWRYWLKTAEVRFQRAKEISFWEDSFQEEVRRFFLRRDSFDKRFFWEEILLRRDSCKKTFLLLRDSFKKRLYWEDFFWKAILLRRNSFEKRFLWEEISIWQKILLGRDSFEKRFFQYKILSGRDSFGKRFLAYRFIFQRDSIEKRFFKEEILPKEILAIRHFFCWEILSKRDYFEKISFGKRLLRK